MTTTEIIMSTAFYFFFAGGTAESSAKKYEHLSDFTCVIISVVRGILWPLVVLKVVYRIVANGA